MVKNTHRVYVHLDSTKVALELILESIVDGTDLDICFTTFTCKHA